jgi:hypothetical protein
MLNGARINLSNLVLNFVSYFWDMTLEAISKMQTPFKDKPATLTAGKARADEKAESARVRWRMSSTF